MHYNNCVTTSIMEQQKTNENQSYYDLQSNIGLQNAEKTTANSIAENIALYINHEFAKCDNIIHELNSKVDELTTELAELIKK